MIARHYTEVELGEATEAKGVSLRVVIGEKEQAPTFVMRVFDVEPGASSPRHAHDWEHEVFILSGTGKVYGGGREVALSPGYTVFVPPMEEHQFSNVGSEVLRFVCLIPRLEEP
ncbi:MAG: cupin domain-containing protein [Anaerolineae bacterium]|nr:cupin domain-containing protein [Anaerolineae bacterium]